MSSAQECLRQKLKQWREAKKIDDKKPVGLKPVTVHRNFQQTQAEKLREKTETCSTTQHIMAMKLKGKPSVQSRKTSVPSHSQISQKSLQSKRDGTLPVHDRRKKEQNENVLRTRKMFGNIPKNLPQISKRTSTTNARGVKRLSRNFTASNKVNQSMKKKTQPVKKQGLTQPNIKSNVPVQNSAKVTKPQKSYVASSKKLKTIIQSYVSSDKKNRTPTVNKTPRNPKGAKRPLNFASNEASAKRARHLSISKSVSRLADTPVTPKNPRTPRRTPKNAKEDEQTHMRGKLKSWLKARGKTPECHRHTSCYGGCEEAWRNPIQLASPGLDECQLARQKKVLDHEDIAKEVKIHVGACMERYRESVPVETVLLDLDKLVGDVPDGRMVSSYWLCKAQLMEYLGNDVKTVEVFDEAMKSGAEPKMDILKALHNFTTRLLQFDKEAEKEDKDSQKKAQTEKKKARRSVRIMEAPLTMPRKMSRMQLHVDEDNIINSSTVKFSVSSCTPLMKNLSINDGDSSPKCYVVTPVRRSTRKSFTDLPRMLQDHDEVIDNLDDLSDHKRNKMLYTENKNLREKLVFDDDDDDDDEDENMDNIENIDNVVDDEKENF